MSNDSRPAKILCMSNHKGGVGKTCSTSNIGAGLARKGKRVLLIDLDPQSNLSLSLGIRDAVDRSVYQVLAGDMPAVEAIYFVTENLDVLPASLDLAGAEIELASEPGRETILKEVLQPVMNTYDYIIIDCPPSLGLLTTNALTAADEVIVPLQAQFLSLQGISKLTKIIEKIRLRLNKNLVMGGVLITQYDKRKTLNRDIADKIQEFFSDTVFETKISDNVALAEAPGAGQDIFRYNPKSKGAADYLSLCDEILLRDSQKVGV